MAYERLNLVDGQVLSATAIKHIEDGIVENEAAAQKAAQTAEEKFENAQNALNAVANDKAPAIFVDATGDMVHITDGAEGMPVQRLITHVEPVETGEGEKSPANPWTIIGWDEVSVTGAGKNLLNPAHFMNTTEADGVYTFSRTGYYANLYTAQNGSAHVIAASDFYKLPVLDTGEYILTQKVTSGDAFTLYAVATDGTKSELAAEVLDTGTPRKTKYTVKARTMVCPIRVSNGNPTVFSELMLEKSGTATEFEPYNGVTLTAELPETLYGFDVNWTTGLVTVDKLFLPYDGTEGWGMGTSSNGLTSFRIGSRTDNRMAAIKQESNYDNYKFVCSHFNRVRYYAPEKPDGSATMVDGTNGRTLMLFNSAWTTVEDCTDYLAAQAAAGTPLTCVFDLAEPYTIQLTPQQLETLKGTNNIWSNAGETEVTYVADTKMYADGKDSTAMIGTAEPGMLATKNYASGDFIVVGKSLYKASAAIATGETITPGTNCTATTVVEQLAAIYNLLNA